jgi:hypothetical protein
MQRAEARDGGDALEDRPQCLTARERGSPATRLDAGHADGAAWSGGNLVRPLIHGAVYFAELVACVREMQEGDLLLFTDWRGDPTGSRSPHLT